MVRRDIGLSLMLPSVKSAVKSYMVSLKNKLFLSHGFLDSETDNNIQHIHFRIT